MDDTIPDSILSKNSSLEHTNRNEEALASRFGIMELFRDPQELEALLNYQFSDRNILVQALTTPSYANEHDISEERIMNPLATLGDALLNVIVIQSLMDAGEFTKGGLTKEKIKHVKNSALPALVEGIGLVSFVQWGEGQVKDEHWKSEHLMGDCLESLVAAVYLDCGRDINLTAQVYARIEELSQ